MSENLSERRCITIQKQNAEKLDKLVAEKKYKNFSQAVDSAITDKLQEAVLDNCDLEQIPENISFINVAKKIAKGVKNEH